MEDEGRPRANSLFSRQASLTFARQFSTTFTGGAGAVLPPTPPNETTADEAQAGQPNTRTPLLRRNSQRQEHQENVQRRMQEQIQRFAEGYCATIAAVFVFFLVLLIIIVVLWIRAVFAAIFYSDIACDQPLQYFVWVVLIWGQVGNQLVKCAQSSFELGPFGTGIAAVLLQHLPGWSIVGWGVYMVHASKTCHKTNPNLYYPTAQYVYAQVCLAALICTLGLMVWIGWRPIQRWLFDTISEFQRGCRPGCEKAVHNLTKIPQDSNELIDPEDNKIRSCPICFDDLNNGETAVRTNCSHYFHEGCLANWCKSNLDCPLCREPVGNADPQENV